MYAHYMYDHYMYDHYMCDHYIYDHYMYDHYMYDHYMYDHYMYDHYMYDHYMYDHYMYDQSSLSDGVFVTDMWAQLSRVVWLSWKWIFPVAMPSQIKPCRNSSKITETQSLSGTERCLMGELSSILNM